MRLRGCNGFYVFCFFNVKECINWKKCRYEGSVNGEEFVVRNEFCEFLGIGVRKL